MTLSKETIELIEKKVESRYNSQMDLGGYMQAITLLKDVFSDESILASVKGDEWVKYDLQNTPNHSEPVFIKYEGYKDVAYYEDGKWINATTDKELPALFIKSLEWLNENLPPHPKQSKP